MGTLQKLKAYFGMVPAEDFDDYDAADDGYPPAHGYGHRPAYLADEDDYESYPAPARRRLFGGSRAGYRDDLDPVTERREEEYKPAGRPPPPPSWAAAAPD